ncbi:chitinase [Actinoplanes friuliensis DSM 7358]|jgi:chitinase|uniref:chitinase n=1 Tax=Actinoplanes friuliensis DSM 7358 TaxID=1246995 RepID=U5VTA4_9ACTN|nr:glycoside hydrolase family 18 protein [Actinoplanes friuliensis]AGZ38891.1 chitinase [Actinoplanes friuliensis DSM 7358]
MRVLPVILSAVLLLAAGCDSSPPAKPAPQTADQQRVVGYFTDWGVYGRNFQVRNVDASGAAADLTHLMYAFGKLDGGKCTTSDKWADYEKPIAAADSVDGVADTPGAGLRGNFGQLRKLKAAHPRLKVIWSFGGWTGSKGFTEAAKDPAAFANSCYKLLTDPRWSGVFDGIDVDWEYPNACGLVCDTSGPDALPGLLKSLRSTFGPEALITAAVPGDLGKLKATDYAAAARSADWLSAMTYDFFGTGGAGTGPTAPHSPLKAYPGIPRETSTTDAAISGLLGLGIPPEKLLLGIGFYGRGWTGVSQAGPGGTASGPAQGSYDKGIEDYAVLQETCPPTGSIGGTSYAVCGGQWWGYDTPETIKAKMAYARSKALGGAFAWELSGDTDDARLVTAMKDGLSG